MEKTYPEAWPWVLPWLGGGCQVIPSPGNYLPDLGTQGLLVMEWFMCPRDPNPFFPWLLVWSPLPSWPDWVPKLWGNKWGNWGRVKEGETWEVCVQGRWEAVRITVHSSRRWSSKVLQGRLCNIPLFFLPSLSPPPLAIRHDLLLYIKPGPCRGNFSDHKFGFESHQKRNLDLD